ncbi:MAG: hypothetical protein CM15mP120_11950 [Pseudomonadota bacterium]|nr:MAG: hypothetical protein CM15mP120_11950 [Pseudomonadota bacterium]
MFRVQPQPAALLEQPVNELERSEDTHGIWRRWSNEQIQQNYLPLWSLIDDWVLLQPPEFAQVLQWRRQQELASQRPAHERNPAPTVYSALPTSDSVAVAAAHRGIGYRRCVNSRTRYRPHPRFNQESLDIQLRFRKA